MTGATASGAAGGSGGSGGFGGLGDLGSGAFGSGGVGGSGGSGAGDDKGDKGDKKKGKKNDNPMGLLKKPGKPRAPKVKWTAENDNKLLIISHGKQLSTKDYAKIAKDFPEGPTPKAIQERYTKIRAKQLLKLKELGIGAPEADIPDLPGPAGEEESAEADEEADPGFVGAGMSTFGAGQATPVAEESARPAVDERVPPVLIPGISTYGADDATLAAETTARQEAAIALAMMKSQQEMEARPRKKVKSSKKGKEDE